MTTFDRHFTLEEATALLPLVEDTFARIDGLKHSITSHTLELEEILKAAGGNGGGRKASGYLDDMLLLSDLVKGLVRQGIQVKDINTGLVDFPHLRDGREVFLCYRVGEQSIQYWHELDDGFAGRQDI